LSQDDAEIREPGLDYFASIIKRCPNEKAVFTIPAKDAFMDFCMQIKKEGYRTSHTAESFAFVMVNSYEVDRVIVGTTVFLGFHIAKLLKMLEVV